MVWARKNKLAALNFGGTRSLIGQGPIEGSRVAARNRRPRGPEYAARERDSMHGFANLHLPVACSCRSAAAVLQQQ